MLLLRQADSKKPTAARTRLGTSDREASTRVFVSKAHEREALGKHSPGPNAYSPTDRGSSKVGPALVQLLALSRRDAWSKPPRSDTGSGMCCWAAGVGCGLGRGWRKPSRGCVCSSTCGGGLAGSRVGRLEVRRRRPLLGAEERQRQADEDLLAGAGRVQGVGGCREAGAALERPVGSAGCMQVGKRAASGCCDKQARLEECMRRPGQGCWQADEAIL
jgi:hypothetical protein